MLFTDEERRLARETDLVELLRRSGEELIRSGKEWRWKRHDSVTIYGNMWYQHSAGVGGDAIEFVKRFANKDYKEAVKILLDEKNIRCSGGYKEKKKNKELNFILPEPYQNMRRIYAYLMKTRGIDADVITFFVKQKKIYEEKQYHNVVFIGLDENDNPKSAFLRGTLSGDKKFRKTIEGSDFKYTFSHNGISNKLYVFESPIDMLSFICLNKTEWQKHSYITLGGLGRVAMLFYLQRNPQIKNVFLCTDNDVAGLKAQTWMKSDLRDLDVEVNSLLPILKDWNEDLVAKKKVEKEEVQTGGMSL